MVNLKCKQSLAFYLNLKPIVVTMVKFDRLFQSVVS